MEEYKPNSFRSKEEAKAPTSKKKLEKVVDGSIKTREKSGLQKLASIFLSEDISSIKSYIVWDVLIPAVKDALSDIIKNGSDMALYGKNGRRSSGARPASKINYSGSFIRQDERRGRGSSRPRDGMNYEEIIFDTRGDADVVLTAMQDVLDQYSFVSVADMYDLAGISTEDYSLNRYGWMDLSSATPVRIRDGYIIKLPKALPLD